MKWTGLCLGNKMYDYATQEESNHTLLITLTMDAPRLY